MRYVEHGDGGVAIGVRCDDTVRANGDREVRPLVACHHGTIEPHLRFRRINGYRDIPHRYKRHRHLCTLLVLDDDVLFPDRIMLFRHAQFMGTSARVTNEHGRRSHVRTAEEHVRTYRSLFDEQAPRAGFAA